MTTYSRDQADGVPTRFIDVSEHPRIKRIALGVDVQDGQTAITVHGYTANGETIVLEHAVVESGSAIVHRSLGGQEVAGRILIADEAGSAEWQAAKDGGSKVDLIRIRAGDTHPLPDDFEDLSGEDVPERFRRYRQAALDRQAGKAEIDELISLTERAIARKAR